MEATCVALPALEFAIFGVLGFFAQCSAKSLKVFHGASYQTANGIGWYSTRPR